MISQDAALQTVGNVGSTAEGLKLLGAQGSLLASFMEVYGSAAGPTRTTAMLSLSALLVGGCVSVALWWTICRIPT